MTTLPDTFAAVLARIEAMGEDVNDYKIITITEKIVADGVAVADVNDLDFLHLLSHNYIEDQTALPCPPWCETEAGHPFESYNANDRQVRPHSAALFREPTNAAYVDLVQEDTRDPGDDSTASQGPAFISVCFEGDYTDSGTVRRLAAALLNAADRLDEVTGSADR